MVPCFRGLVNVLDISIQEAHEEGIKEKDTFFYCASYTADTGRVAALHPAIRTGPNYQVRFCDLFVHISRECWPTKCALSRFASRRS